jgi:hypothetical protein
MRWSDCCSDQAREHRGAYRKALARMPLQMLFDASQVPRHLLPGEHTTPSAESPAPAACAATPCPSSSPTRRHARLFVRSGRFGVGLGAGPAAAEMSR